MSVECCLSRLCKTLCGVGVKRGNGTQRTGGTGKVETEKRVKRGKRVLKRGKKGSETRKKG